MLNKWQPCINDQASFENKYLSLNVSATNKRLKFKFFEDKEYILIVSALLIMPA